MADIEFHFGRPRLTEHDRAAFEALRRVLERKNSPDVSPEDWAAYRRLILSPWQSSPADEAPDPGAVGRYRRALGDLETLFGDLGGMDIAEIGAGYGAQCKLIATAHAFASYAIFDLAPMTELVFKYLERVGCRALSQVRGAHLDGAGGQVYDLVISHWAIWECEASEQARYIEQVFRRSRRGYLACGRRQGDGQARQAFIEALGFPVQSLGGGSGAEGERLYWTEQPFV